MQNALDASIRSFALRFGTIVRGWSAIKPPARRTSRLLTGEIKSAHGVQINKTSLIREYGEHAESVYGERRGAEIAVECEHQTELSRCTSTCAYRNLILARVFSLHNQSYTPHIASSLPSRRSWQFDRRQYSPPPCKQIYNSRLRHQGTHRDLTDFLSVESVRRRSFLINLSRNW